MIKIIRGVYGYWNGRRVIPKDKDSAPFELPAEQEHSLVQRGIAEFVGDAPAPAAVAVDELPPMPDGVEGIPEYSAESSAKDLRAIGKKVGITFGVGVSKAEMAAQLDAFFDANMTDEAPEVEDADEVPPVFDAAEAVQ